MIVIDTISAAILVGVSVGSVAALIRIAYLLINNRSFKISQLVGYLILYVLLGGIASVLAFLGSIALNPEVGLLILLILASLFSVQFVEQQAQLLGIKIAKDLFADTIGNENAIDEKGILDELKATKQENVSLKKQIRRLQDSDSENDNEGDENEKPYKKPNHK